MKNRQGTKITTSRKSVLARTPSTQRRTASDFIPTEEPFAEVAAASRSGGLGARRVATEPVHLEMTHPSARNVCIAGSFNGWQATEMVRMGGGKWAIDLMLSPGSYEYRFVVDGKWMADPNVPHTVPNPFGEPNSLLVVPAERGGSASREIQE